MSNWSRRGMVALGALGLAACADAGLPEAGGAEAAKAQSAAGADTYGAGKLPLTEYMAHVVEYNAMNIWKWQGFILNENGKRSLEPKNPEEWEQAEGAALTLVELTEPLLRPSTIRDEKVWTARVLELRAAAAEAARAAEKQDVKAFEAAGDRLNAACMQCHYAFAPHLERPQPAD